MHDTTGGTELIDAPALALSGGGYRALLFHLGALWRLNELGWLKRLTRIDGVSGGAVLAAYLGLNWSSLAFDNAGVAVNFTERIVLPLRRLCTRVLDIPVGLCGLIWPVSALPYALGRMLFGAAALDSLPDGGDGPRICLLATNLLTGGLVELSARGVHEPFLGDHPARGVPLAVAVAASCSIPPSFRPVTLSLDPGGWRGACTPEAKRTRARRAALRLVDGGNSDNQGLTYIRDSYRQVLASDGSSPVVPWSWISGDWLTATLRSNRVLIDRVRQQHIKLLAAGNGNGQQAAYWALAGAPASAPAAALACNAAATRRLAQMRTRMGRHTQAEQGRLLNWGYCACDSALRAGIDPGTAAAAWPVPEHSLE